MSFTYEEERCYVCGAHNPEGLKLKFEHIPGGHSRVKVVFEARHQGYDNIVHGGIISAVLDDSMAHAVMALNLLPVTTEMHIKYRKPVLVGEEILFEGRVDRVGRRLVETSAKAIGPEGDIRVEAEGKFFIGAATGRIDVGGVPE